jgi:hypothetical protein
MDPTIRRQREIEQRQRSLEAPQEQDRDRRLQEMQHREQEAQHRRRLAALESEWQMFKAAANAAIRQNQAQAAAQHRQQLMDEIHALIHPPHPQEPAVIVVEEGTGRLGYSDFDPTPNGSAVALVVMRAMTKIPSRLAPRGDGAMEQIRELFGFLTPDSAGEFSLPLRSWSGLFRSLRSIGKRQAKRGSYLSACRISGTESAARKSLGSAGAAFHRRPHTPPMTQGGKRIMI